MTVSSIGSGAPSFSEAGIGLSGEGRLAFLVLQHEQTEQDASREQKALARQQYISATDAEVEALEDEAEDTRLGAFVQGAATLTSAAIQLGDTCLEPSCDPETGIAPKEKPWCEIAAGGTAGLGGGVGKLFDAEVAEDRADGKRAQKTAQLAEWDLAEAKEAIQQSEQRQDKATDWLAANDANQASTMAAIFAGFA